MSINPKHMSSVHSLSVTRIPRVFLSLSVRGKPDREMDDSNAYYERILHSYSIGEYERVINHYRCNSEQNEDNPIDGYHANEYILRATENRECIWIICEKVSSALTLLGFWDLMDAGIVTLPGVHHINGTPNIDRTSASGYVAIGGRVEMIVCKYKKCTIRIVGIANYGDMSLENIFDANSDEINASLVKYGEDHEQYPNCLDIQRAIGEWYRKTLLKWKHEDCGTWKMTSSQLTHSIYRRKFLKKKLTTYRKPELDRLERAAVFGGRAEVYYLGDVCRFQNDIGKHVRNYVNSQHRKYTDKIYRLDISSMYPYIFSQFDVPGHCIFHDVVKDIRHLEFALKSGHIAVAAVTLDTKIPEYPVRVHASTVEKSVVVNERFKTLRQYIPPSVEYPVGRFDTVLIGPELEQAFSEGAIKALHEYAVYLPSGEYQDYMQYLINKRYEAKILGDKVAEKLWKNMGNSFGGKLAQRSRGWIAAPTGTIVNKSWGEWQVVDYDTSDVQKYRAIAGYPQIFREDEYSPKGRPIVWGYVCAVARYLMRAIRNLLPQYTVLQMDTDGLYVTAEAMPYIEKYGILNPGVPGGLRIVSEHNHIRFWGPRHYVVDSQFVMSGFSTGFTYVNNNMYIDKKEASVCKGKRNEAPVSIATNIRTVSLSCGIGEYRINDIGEVAPYCMETQSGWKTYGESPMAGLFRGIGDC